MNTVVMMLTNGMEIIGTLRTDKSSSKEYVIEFPQQVKWWRDPTKGQCYEFVPYLYGANLQMNIPIKKDHVTSMMECNEDVEKQYRDVVDSLLGHMERMISLKRKYDESGSKTDFEVTER